MNIKEFITKYTELEALAKQIAYRYTDTSPENAEFEYCRFFIHPDEVFMEIVLEPCQPFSMDDMTSLHVPIDVLDNWEPYIANLVAEEERRLRK